jgi:transposase-like protein
MKKKGFGAEHVIEKLREADVLLGQGSTAGEVRRKLGVTEQTYYRWRRESGGMQVYQARMLKELEKENREFKKEVGGQPSRRNAVRGMILIKGNLASLAPCKVKKRLPFTGEMGRQTGINKAKTRCILPINIL